LNRGVARRGGGLPPLESKDKKISVSCRSKSIVKTPLQLTLFWITLQRLQHDDLNSFSDSATASSAASLRSTLHNSQEQLVSVRLMCRPITVYKISFLCQHIKCLALVFVVCTDFE